MEDSIDQLGWQESSYAVVVAADCVEETAGGEVGCVASEAMVG